MKVTHIHFYVLHREHLHGRTSAGEVLVELVYAAIPLDGVEGLGELLAVFVAARQYHPGARRHDRGDLHAGQPQTPSLRKK